MISIPNQPLGQARFSSARPCQTAQGVKLSAILLTVSLHPFRFSERGVPSDAILVQASWRDPLSLLNSRSCCRYVLTAQISHHVLLVNDSDNRSVDVGGHRRKPATLFAQPWRND